MAETVTFDYIVVGAGSAGCVLANRLSADPKNRVLLLEAGGKDSNPWLHIPIGYAKVFLHPKYNWVYETEPEPGLNGRAGTIPRGKVLGGSSAVNGLVYIRGQREDYDHWRQLGNTGWDYDSVLPYFRRSEHQQRGPDEFHGGDGPLHVSDPPERNEICDAFIAAAEQAGIPRNSDFNGAIQEGAGYFQQTAKNGRRHSTATAYLKPIRGRRNLEIVTNANVERIVFEGVRAVGVDYTIHGQRHVARAGRDIVLSAGAINSPLLLQRSGVGPGGLLRSHNIPVIKDLPGVGHDLTDHYNVWVAYRVKIPITLNDVGGTLAGRIGMAARYALFRKGYMSSGPGAACAFIRTDQRLATPDVQVHVMMFSTSLTEFKMHPFPGMSTALCNLRPESRGYVEIRDANSATPPKIRFNYLSTEGDRQTLIRGMRTILGVMDRPALKPYIEGVLDFDWSRTSDTDLHTFIRERGRSSQHAACSCRMGVDDRAVVDPRLRVRGIEGLRVADASVMPSISSGNTNAPTIMIGEKASDMILEDSRSF